MGKFKKHISSEPYLKEKYNHADLKVYPTSINFQGTDPDEPRICIFFGCIKILSPQENLFGDTCVTHKPKNRI